MTALVTGASSGIGLQYATVLARDYACDLLLVSNQEKELAETASTLSGQYGVKALPYYCDLSRKEAADEVYAFAHGQGLEIDILINNAGIFFFNPLVETPEAKIDTMLMLHMVTVVNLCRLFGEDMCRRGNGYILNMSSLCNWMTFPGIQTYDSTKTFIYSFSKSIWYEFKPKGVSVTVLTPGAVDTGLYGLADDKRRLAVKLGVSIPPEKLAEKALRKMFKRKKTYMPGFVNHVAKPFFRIFPDWLVFKIMKKLSAFQKA